MNATVFNFIWATDWKPAEKLVALYLADRGRKSGKCYAKAATIAKSCGLELRQTRRYLKRLVEDRGVFIATKHPSKPTTYRLNPNHACNQLGVSPMTSLEARGVSLKTVRGVAHDTPGVSPMTHKTLIEHSSNGEDFDLEKEFEGNEAAQQVIRWMKDRYVESGS